jgi:hypothetical protein
MSRIVAIFDFPVRERISEPEFPDPRSKFLVPISREFSKSPIAARDFSPRQMPKSSGKREIACIFPDDQGI